MKKSKTPKTPKTGKTNQVAKKKRSIEEALGRINWPRLWAEVGAEVAKQAEVNDRIRARSLANAHKIVVYSPSCVNQGRTTVETLRKVARERLVPFVHPLQS